MYEMCPAENNSIDKRFMLHVLRTVNDVNATCSVHDEHRRY